MYTTYLHYGSCRFQMLHWAQIRFILNLSPTVATLPSVFTSFSPFNLLFAVVLCFCAHRVYLRVFSPPPSCLRRRGTVCFHVNRSSELILLFSDLSCCQTGKYDGSGRQREMHVHQTVSRYMHGPSASPTSHCSYISIYLYI